MPRITLPLVLKVCREVFYDNLLMINLFIYVKKGEKMANTDLADQVLNSGILKDFEKIIFTTPAVHKIRGRGAVVLTDCKFYFLVRPSRFSEGSILNWATSRFSKGFIQDFSVGINNIISASTRGLLAKHLVVQTREYVNLFSCDDPQYYADLIVQTKKDVEKEDREYRIEKERKKEGRYCTKCGRKIPFDAYICPYCGFNFEDETEYIKEDSENSKTYIDENGYYRFKDTNILVHRWLMEKHTGRKLEPWEVVHHIDGNKLNNSPENLRIMTGPKSREHHTKIHKKQKEETGNWHGIIKCPECGTEYKEKVNFCSICGNKL